MISATNEGHVCYRCGEEKAEVDFHNWRHDRICKRCHAARNRACYERSKEQRLAAIKAYRESHREQIDAWQSKWQRKFKFGTDGAALLVRQEGKCCICGCVLDLKAGRRGPRDGAACIDHCHESGIVRGLLCWNCNIGLGKFRDSSDFLRKAADYLDRFEMFK